MTSKALVARTRRRRLLTAALTVSIATISIATAQAASGNTATERRTWWVSATGTGDGLTRDTPTNPSALDGVDLAPGSRVVFTGDQPITAPLHLSDRDGGSTTEPVVIAGDPQSPVTLQPPAGQPAVTLTDTTGMDVLDLTVIGSDAPAAIDITGTRTGSDRAAAITISGLASSGTATGVHVAGAAVGAGVRDLRIAGVTVERGSDSVTTSAPAEATVDEPSHQDLIITGVIEPVQLVSVDRALVDGRTAPAGTVQVSTDRTQDVRILGGSVTGGAPTPAPPTTPAAPTSNGPASSATSTDNPLVTTPATVTAASDSTGQAPTSSSTQQPVPTAASTPIPTTASAPAAPPAAGPDWLSGSDNGSSWKQFADWRGGMTMAGTWTDAGGAPSNQQHAPSWMLATSDPKAQWRDWTGPIDIAIGGFSDGHTWASAANGELDDHWRAILTNLRDSWAPRDPANLYIRPWHEFNGNWMPWSVTASDLSNYKTAWARFRQIQQQVIPKAHLIWSPNSGTLQDYDVRDAFPGADLVDVIGVDWYNAWPHASTAAELATKFDAVDGRGAPVGLERWRQFAESVGRPLGVPEWGNAAIDNGAGGADAPDFFTAIHDWFAQHAGTGAGQLRYEIYFNVSDPKFKERWYLFDGSPNDAQPHSAARYLQLWS